MKCFKCSADMKQSTTTDVTEINGCLIIIRNVPCFKCTECNEVFYIGTVVKQLENIIETVKNITNEITIIDYTKQIA